MSRTPRKKLPPLRGPFDVVGDHGCSHSTPTNDKRDRPTICYRCNKPILNCEHRIWWSVKPLTFDEQVAKQKAEDEDADRRKSFAERMHAKREQAKLAKMTREEKDAILAAAALKKAQKLRKKHGLGKKPR